MIRLITHTLDRMRSFFAPRGKHRSAAAPRHEPNSPTSQTAPLVCPNSPGRLRHRSPYGLDLPLNGAETRLVRPYLTALERERALQQRRRPALVLAADFGVDLDRHLIGVGEGAA